jgi:hypothetical protein
MNRKVEILSGNFTSAGNYSGYDDDGLRYFIPKRLMEAKGFTSDEDVKLPFWTKAGIKENDVLDPNQEPELDAKGKPIPLLTPRVLLNADGTHTKSTRLQVFSIFSSREELVTNCVNKASIDIDIQAGIVGRATSAGLTEDMVQALLAVSL